MRGEIFHVVIPRTRGHEQKGARYAVVVQSDDLRASSTWLVAPTSASAPEKDYRPLVEIQGAGTRVLAEQTTTVNRTRLGASVGHLSSDELRQVDEALRLVLDL